jgi:type IV secretory pathway VirB3-like protein
MTVPLYKGLSERITLLGIPRNITIILVTYTSSAFFMFESLYFLLIGFFIYIVLVLLYRIDPFFLEILLKHINQPDYFDI